MDLRYEICHACHVTTQRKDRLVRTPESRLGQKDRPVKLPESRLVRKDWPVKSTESRLGRKDRPVRSPESRLGRKDRPAKSPESRLGRGDRPARSPEGLPRPESRSGRQFCGQGKARERPKVPKTAAKVPKCPKPDRKFIYR